jgi:tricorn protease
MRGKVGEGETVLHKYEIEKQKDHRFAEGVSWYAVSPDGKKMLVRKGIGYHIAETSGEKISLEGNSLDLSNMEMLVDREAEYRQMFDEVWRMERDFFYDKEMHGVDWDAMKKRYQVLLPHIAHRYDLTYVIGELIGELACSHTYVGGGDKPTIPSSEVGILGVDFEIDSQNDRIKITRILRGENWNEQLRSPLLDPGIDVKEGDYLLAINGQELSADINPYSLTVNTVGKLLNLTVNDKPEMEGAKTVAVRPLASEEALRYYNWVEDRREYVDSVSDGQIGYIHLPDMDTQGLVKFAEMFYHQIRKPGLIIDVRYNGGGFVSGLILERLRRVVKAMGMSRNGGVSPAPGAGLNAHMITLLNEFSCSDGDYFPYFFREYDLGPLLGKRSWGGVIGIRGYRPLLDGGYYTAPEFGIYSLDGEWIMENVGVEPDMEVENLPDRLALGYDDQLDAAIEYISEKIQEDPKVLPPLPPPPEKR